VWLLGPLGMAVDWKTGRIEGDIDDAPADDLPERDITEDQEEHPAHTDGNTRTTRQSGSEKAEEGKAESGSSGDLTLHQARKREYIHAYQHGQEVAPSPSCAAEMSR